LSLLAAAAVTELGSGSVAQSQHCVGLRGGVRNRTPTRRIRLLSRARDVDQMLLTRLKPIVLMELLLPKPWNRSYLLPVVNCYFLTIRYFSHTTTRPSLCSLSVGRRQTSHVPLTLSQ